jgi:hypothetical protein
MELNVAGKIKKKLLKRLHHLRNETNLRFWRKLEGNAEENSVKCECAELIASSGKQV